MFAPDFVDAVSNYFEGLKDWIRRRKYRLERNEYVDAGLTYIKYFLFELLPYVVAYGLMTNFPLAVLLGYALTVETVISWGLVFYLVDEEFISMFERAKPYIRVKVDN